MEAVMKKKIFVLIIFLLFLTNFLVAQQEPVDPIDELTFAPELLMQHQQAIGLDEKQRSSIKKEVQQAQAKFTDLQWELENEMEKLLSHLKQKQVNEQQTLLVLDKILKIESDIKKTHLVLAIRIKNLLTAKQQEQLQKIKKNMRQNMMK